MVSAPVVDDSAVVCSSVVGPSVGWLVVDATSVVSTISPVVVTDTVVVDSLVVNAFIVVESWLVIADVAAGVVTVDSADVSSVIVVVSSLTVVTDPKYYNNLFSAMNTLSYVN